VAYRRWGYAFVLRSGYPGPGVQARCGLRVSISRYVGAMLDYRGSWESASVLCAFVAVVPELGGSRSFGVCVVRTRPEGLIDDASWAALVCSDSGIRERWTVGLSMGGKALVGPALHERGPSTYPDGWEGGTPPCLDSGIGKKC
jgi:hypothetical protein